LTGNPRKIEAVGDLGRRGLRFVNRQLGSATRAFTDEALAAAGVEHGAVVGYREEVSTHWAVALRILRGEADVFASANMEHPEALARAGKVGPVVMFARNRLCALARPEVGVTADTLLDRLLDPAVTLGTSTPRADPSGDYAWEVFRRAEALRPGSQARLEAKARQLVGGPASPPAGPERLRAAPDRPPGRRVPHVLHERRPSRPRAAEPPGRVAARAPRGRRGLRPDRPDSGARGSAWAAWSRSYCPLKARRCRRIPSSSRETLGYRSL
jgi:PBP superfamily domain